MQEASSTSSASTILLPPQTTLSFLNGLATGSSPGGDQSSGGYNSLISIENVVNGHNEVTSNEEGIINDNNLVNNNNFNGLPSLSSSANSSLSSLASLVAASNSLNSTLTNNLKGSHTNLDIYTCQVNPLGVNNNNPFIIPGPRAVLSCCSNSHPFEERSLDVSSPVKIGRAVARCKPTATNTIFDCKVLSRNHALLWFEDNKVCGRSLAVTWIRMLFLSFKNNLY